MFDIVDCLILITTLQPQTPTAEMDMFNGDTDHQFHISWTSLLECSQWIALLVCSGSCKQTLRSLVLQVITTIVTMSTRRFVCLWSPMSIFMHMFKVSQKVFACF
uniref:Uncharacterized protein n=1 Tax=Physcomitrium patens TaxID=3218 RepID=A0A2K1JH63_PHYPA|nr:hypothetical protein PHYPA_018039 [Physcomitrium patens]